MTTKILLILFALLALASLLSRKRPPEVRRDRAPRVEAAAKCPVCDAYVLAGAAKCGRGDCPRPSA